MEGRLRHKTAPGPSTEPPSAAPLLTWLTLRVSVAHRLPSAGIRPLAPTLVRLPSLEQEGTLDGGLEEKGGKVFQRI